MTTRVLVTGATGYIGGRLVPKLLEAGYAVRCLTRDPGKLRDVPWSAQVEIAQGDAGDAADLQGAMAGVEVAYYLIHAIGAGDFETMDRQTATAFGAAAKAAGLRRIVYLGGMAPDHERLSTHLRSRQEVGQILLDCGVPTTVLQAAVIVGSGGASFEMLRYLTERLPAMLTPTWVQTRIQPIAVRDVLRYLVGSAEMPPEVNRRFDIGGPDVVTYEQMMQTYARVAGLRKRIIVRVPILSPKVSAHWVNVVTPVPRSIAAPLVESLVNEVVAHDHDIAQYVPDPEGGRIDLECAIRLAIKRVREADVETSWSSASWGLAPSDPLPTDPDWAGGSLYLDERDEVVTASPAQLWAVIEGIGGANGWYSWPLAWAVRGWMDKLGGGPGLGRGRRDAKHLREGDVLDWWRVEHIDRGEMLRLRAEMKNPGKSWLELSVRAGTDGTHYHQRAIFYPRGLAGQAYWWAIKPFHGVVFGGMLRNIAAAAEREPREQEPAVDSAA
jgi:uncharacterized protein YbjT (DUF2867 family)